MENPPQLIRIERERTGLVSLAISQRESKQSFISLDDLRKKVSRERFWATANIALGVGLLVIGGREFGPEIAALPSAPNLVDLGSGLISISWGFILARYGVNNASLSNRILDATSSLKKSNLSDITVYYSH